VLLDNEKIGKIIYSPADASVVALLAAKPARTLATVIALGHG
jgi:hypothetical protein